MFLNSRRSKLAVTFVVLMMASGVPLARRDASAQTPREFSLHAIDGRTITSEDLHGQIVVLALGASWLPLSRKQAEGLKKFANEHANQGLVVYFVATDSDSPKSKTYATDAQLRAFSLRNDLTLTILRDPDGLVFKQFGVDQIPAFVIFDKQGHMVGTPIGGLDSDGDVIGQLAPYLNEIP
jgi:peroxiredoxin